MQRLKLVVLAAMAVLSLSALVAASASAVTPAAILPETAKVEWTGTSGSATLTSLLGLKFACEKDTSSGSFAIAAKLGPFTIDFEKCKDATTGSVCTGLGEATAGTVLVKGEDHLVVDTETPALGAGLLFLVNLVHYTCGIALNEMKGELLCLIKPVGTKTKHFEIVCEESTTSGDPKETTYWNEKGEEKKINAETGGLLTSVSHGAFKGSAEDTTALIFTNPEITIDA